MKRDKGLRSQFIPAAIIVFTCTAAFLSGRDPNGGRQSHAASHIKQHPLMAAIVDGDQQRVAHAVNKYIADINAPLPVQIDFNHFYFITPLMLAARQGNVPAAALLISVGADVSAVDHAHNTALHWACGVHYGLPWGQDRHGAFIDRALSRPFYQTNTEVDRIESILGRPLLSSIELVLCGVNAYNAKPMIQLLLTHGAQPDRQNGNGITPMMAIAHMSRSCHPVRLLLQKGASLLTHDNAGRTPKEYANKVIATCLQ
ncbi:MAG: ankyrin repeat domain-containing protein [Planctomycetota bacterium]|nr:MAG: ankyrin repeat domain-containing protein [Planctomycetota bacterium]